MPAQTTLLRATASAVALSLALSLLGAPAGAGAPAAAAARSLHIVLLADAPLVRYAGGVAGLAATDPLATGDARLDAGSAASRAYRAWLADRQDAAVARMEAALGRDLAVRFRYDAVLNGVAVSLSAAEAERVRELPGVTRVERDGTLRLLTDAGPAWIGAPAIWAGSGGGAPTRGEGVVVGVIDTGVNHDHPSFAEVGGDGYRHTNPRGTFYGECDPLTGAPFCNDKLIGAWDFTGTTPEDTNGHGSHTASTAAGNVLDARLVAPTMTLEERISGVAPHANLITYKACVTNCPVSGTLGSINQATLDEVDVINFSIGGDSSDPWADLLAQAFLGARRAGVLVASSAGNEGPGASTQGGPSNAPWVMAVGASTHDRKFQNALVDLAGGASTAPGDLAGKSVTAAYGPAPVVYAGDFGDPLCGAPFPPGTWTAGEIVVCDRGVNPRVEKASNVKTGGAGGFVLANDEPSGDSTVADPYALPGVNISFAHGVTLKTWLASGSGHSGRITGTQLLRADANGDVMAAFSSRGPDASVPGVIKPDVTAPGVDILAAFNSTTPGPPEYGVISGTSMSGPHAAGAGALMRALHPDWSPDQVKSALMLTAFTTPDADDREDHPVLKEDAATRADAFDMGAGRVDLEDAARVGLVLDESADAYDAANPSTGGDPTTLNLASLGSADCAGTCTWQRTFTAVAGRSVTWTVVTTAPAGMSINVSPSSFTLADGATRTVSVSADVRGLAVGTWYFGEVRLIPSVAGVAEAHLPLAVLAQAGGSTAQQVTLHFQGNTEEGCLGNGALDLDGCGGPFLLEKADLDAGPAAAFGPAPVILDCTPQSGGRCASDPNWAWQLDSPKVLEGPMQVVWWETCPGCNLLFFNDYFIRLWVDPTFAADDAPDVEVRVRHNTLAGAAATRLGAKIQLPRLEANQLVVLSIDPIFINQDQTTIHYDSDQGCTPAVAGPCDSYVRMPVVRLNTAPDAVDDSATATLGGTVSVPVLANDSDVNGDSLSVISVTQPAHGTATANADGTVSYTHDGSGTAPDAFSYTISDGRGGEDTASVAVTVTAPNLRVTALSASGGKGREGDRITLTATISNVGDAAAAASQTEFLLDGTTVLGTAATPALAAGASSQVSLVWETRGVKGEHVVRATADRTGVVAESVETDNSAQLTVSLKGNRVQNGSFEQADSSGQAPAGWQGQGTGAGSADWSDGGSDGQKSASTSGNGGNALLAGAPSWTSAPISVNPGETLDLVVSVEATGASSAASAGLAYLGSAGELLRTVTLISAPLTTAGFATLEESVTIPAGVSSVRVVLSGFSPTDTATGGTVRFDSVGLFAH